LSGIGDEGASTSHDGAVRYFDSMRSEADRQMATMQRERDMLMDHLQSLVVAERDHTTMAFARLEERLLGMDRATALLNETVNRVPTDLQQGMENLRAVLNERFASVGKQFDERDTRSEREARDNKVAVDAAFAAQKDAATQTDIANAKAIDKSEVATTETINKLGELFNSSHRALGEKIDSFGKNTADKIDDLKQRVQSIESSTVGGRQAVGDQHQRVNTTTAILAVIISALIVAVGLYAALHK
jgi:transglutaminase/protease-like cytokinesis protein 3